MTICRSVGSRAGAFALGAMFLASVSAPAAAQENDPNARGLAAAATNAATTSAAKESAAEAQPAAPADNPVLKFFANTEFTGFVDTYYTYNFNKPSTACATFAEVAQFNCLHNFDFTHNSFSLNLAELAIEKKPAADSRAGFRVDFDYGPTAAWVAAFDPGTSTIFQHIQQAYVSYLAPTSKGSLQFDFGKFVTPIGFEVIESKDNWNYSRSLLFALAIPYYHQGLRVAYSPNDKSTITGFVFNGWNNSVDNNTGKSVGIQGLFKPTSPLAITLNYIGGPEQTNNNDDWRHLFDATVTYTASAKASVALNYDYGTDKGTDQTWQGVAVYLKYQANGWFAAVPRYEYLNDKDGFMTGTPQDKVQEFTLTLEFKHKDGFLTRVEYRGDFADVPYFIKELSGMKKNQNVVTIGWVYAFSSKTP
jgi:putative OmpL-like beta-barrel porin-2